MDIADLLKDKRGVLKYILQTIESSTKNSKGLLSMKERGFSDAGMLEKVIEVTAIQSSQIQALSMIGVTCTFHPNISPCVNLKNDGLRDFFIFILRSHINILFSIPKLFPKTNSHY